MAKTETAAGKDRWSLVPWESMRQVVRAFTFGAAKHDKPGVIGYRTADPEMYFDAAMRHLAEYRCGTRADHETGLHPLAHAAASLLVVIWHELKE